MEFADALKATLKCSSISFPLKSKQIEALRIVFDKNRDIKYIKLH